MARGTVKVCSTIGIPPLATASAANSASSGVDTRIAGMTPISSMRARTSSLLLLIEVRLRRRQYVAVPRDPDIQCGQQENIHHHGYHEASYDDNRERPLRIGADAARQGRRQQTECRDQGGHH